MPRNRQRVVKIPVYSVSFRDIDEVVRTHNLLKDYGLVFVAKYKRNRCRKFVAVPSRHKFILKSQLPLKTSRVSDSGENMGIVPAPFDNTTASPFKRQLIQGQNTGEIVIGRMGTSFFTISLDDLWRHVGVIGTTGSGKSHTVAFMLSSLVKTPCAIVVLDWHNEYSNLLESYMVDFFEYRLATLPRIPFCPRGSSDVEWFVDVARAVLGLSNFQTNILKLLLLSLGGEKQYNYNYNYLFRLFGIDNSMLIKIRKRDPLDAFVNLWRILEDKGHFLITSRAEREVWFALLRRLETIFSSQYSFLFTCQRTGDDERDILSLSTPGIHVLRVGEIEDLELRRIYVSFTIYYLFRAKIRKIINNCLVLVIEEVNSVIGNKSVKKIIEEILSEARKYRMGLILVAQSLGDFTDSRILSNINTLILHKMHNVIDLGIVSKIVYGDEAKRTLMLLNPGEAIVYSSRAERPVLVKVPYAGITKE